VENILEMIMHVRILEQYSTNVGLSQFVTVSRVKGKVVSEVLRKYDVCVKYNDVPHTTMPRHISTNPEAGVSFANLGPETEM